MTRDRMASSLALPPALRMTWVSPSVRPANFAGSSLASMHVRIAKRREGGMGNFPFFPNRLPYSRFAARTSFTILLITRLLLPRNHYLVDVVYRIPLRGIPIRPDAIRLNQPVFEEDEDYGV